MLYLNQRKFRHIPYNHNVAFGGAPEERRNVATSGCGLCSLCMVVDHLTDKALPIEECVKLSENNGANKYPGTSLTVLAPIIADMYGLDVDMTSDKERMLNCLRTGGEVIANVGGNRDGYNGIFSRGGHYIVIISADAEDLCILDPATEEGRYDVDSNTNKLNLNNLPFIYCSADVIVKETENREPSFYLFKRKIKA